MARRAETGLCLANPRRPVRESSSLTLPFRAHRQEELRLLSYNVWFNEGIHVAKRMWAIGRIIAAHNPHVICLQEVTPNIKRYLAASNRSWWDKYEVACGEPAMTPYFTLLLVAKGHLAAPGSRQPFHNSRMGRDLSVARVRFRGRELAVATSHLESFVWQTKQSNAEERTAQFREALEVLGRTGPSGKTNAIFVGDTNWDEKTDGEMQLPPGFRDAWRALHPDDPGFTYDAKRNTMLLGGLQKRLDRAVVSLADFELRSVQLVGTEKLPGVTYQKKRYKQGQPYQQQMDVFPSDHFGLLLTLKLRPPKKGQTLGRQTLGTAAPGSAADNPVDLSD